MQTSEQAPIGWLIAGSNPGDYSVSLDKQTSYKSKRSVLLEAKKKQPAGFITLAQDFDAKKYRGKRMQFSAFVKSDTVTGWAGLWMQVDGAGKDVLAFDNMKNRAIKETTDWKNYSVVLNVASESKVVGFGILLSGSGKVWIADASFKEVDKKVQSTDMQKPLKQAPTNLSFEE